MRVGGWLMVCFAYGTTSTAGSFSLLPVKQLSDAREAMGGRGLAGAEVFEVFDARGDGNLGGDRSERRKHRGFEQFRSGLGAEVEDQLAGVEGFLEAVRQLGG